MTKVTATWMTRDGVALRLDMKIPLGFRKALTPERERALDTAGDMYNMVCEAHGYPDTFDLTDTEDD